MLSICMGVDLVVIPPKTNMEPENDGLIGISFSRGSFSGSMLVFGGVSSPSTASQFRLYTFVVENANPSKYIVQNNILGSK